MARAIEMLMSEDHARLDRLLARSQRPDGTIDAAAYGDFRGGLLRHIAMEEKVLLPFARTRNGGAPLAIAAALRADHGKIAKLLVPTPTPALCDELRTLLGAHNALEEGPRGLYATCDALAGDDVSDVLARLRALPEVPVAPHYDGPPHVLRRSPPADRSNEE
jgi:hypothetical protein